MFVVAGDGLLRPEFEEHRGCGNLRMVGWQRDIAPLLKACDVVLLTSINEGTPTALIEAMFAAKPFVATDAGGTSELAVELQLPVAGIQNAKNGFIVQRDARALVECLKNFATNESLGCTMGERGREHAVKNWGSENLLKEITQLYDELAGSAKSRARAV